MSDRIEIGGHGVWVTLGDDGRPVQLGLLDYGPGDVPEARRLLAQHYTGAMLGRMLWENHGRDGYEVVTPSSDGERLYVCLLAVRPTQFSESGPAPQEPRPTWSELGPEQQWTREDWERIAELFIARADRTGEALYACIQQVSPRQRRRSGHMVERERWTTQGHKKWCDVADRFNEEMLRGR